MAEIAILLRKQKKNPNQPDCLRPLGQSFLCELSLNAEFQLPRLCLSKVEGGKISFSGSS